MRTYDLKNFLKMNLFLINLYEKAEHEQYMIITRGDNKIHQMEEKQNVFAYWQRGFFLFD